jgi:predicted nucleic acid-binding protein
VSLLVDTGVWSLALRRDAPPGVPEVRALRDALAGGDIVATTGVILQELLQGVIPERVRRQITETFAVLEYLAPSRDDHVAAAGVRNTLRSAGVQVGTIDALIAQLAIAGSHTVLSTDKDFHQAAGHVGLRLWQSTPSDSSADG